MIKTQFKSTEKVELIAIVVTDVFTAVEKRLSLSEVWMHSIGKSAANLGMPVEARRKGVFRKVFVEMIVETDGTTSNHNW